MSNNLPGIEIDWNALSAASTGPIPVVKADLEIDWNTVGTSTEDNAGDTLKIPAMTYVAADDNAPVNPPVKVEPTPAEIAALKLIDQERDIAHAFGAKHDDGKLFFAAGTELYDVGLTTAKELATAYAALPTITDAAEQHAATLASEARAMRDFVPSEWRINASGRLTTRDAKVAATMSDTAWSQLTAMQSKIEASQDASPEQRAAIADAKDLPSGNVNGWVHLVNDPRKARVRDYRGARQVFAIVSGSSRGYTVCDGDDVLRKLARVIPDTRCEINYDARTTRLKARAYVQAPCDIPAFTKVGRVHKAGVQLTTRDDGMGSIEMRLFLERIRCKNHSLTSESFGMVRRKHTGDYTKLVNQLHTLVEKMPEMIEQMRSLWSRAASEFYTDAISGGQLDAREAFTRLVMNEHIPTGGLEPTEAIDAYMRAWQAEETPNSAAGIVMAMQRAAHETTWATRWADDTIEESASALLYQRVLTLDSVAA